MTALVVMPGGIAVFTAFLGKALSDLAGLWRTRMNGYGDFSNKSGHTVVLGWQEGRTRRLLELLTDDQPDGDRIVLVSKLLAQNPLPMLVDYVRVDALSIPTELQRAGVENAKTVVIRGQDDDETLAATLAVVSEAPSVHVVSFFGGRARDRAGAAAMPQRRSDRVDVGRAAGARVPRSRGLKHG